MLPYHDENATRRPAVITWTVIALNVLVWVIVQGAGSSPSLPASVCNLGLIAGELTGRLPPGIAFEMGEGLLCLTDPGRAPSHLVTSMFLHGSWMHLLGNMWFLYLFGNNIEDAMGRMRFIVFYLLSGLSAAALQVWTDPGAIVPMVGASGAISGVMGAYLVLYPSVRVRTLVPIGFFFMVTTLPAWAMLIYWFVLQLLGGLFIAGPTGGVAFWAHIGGFVAGLALIKLFARPEHIRSQRIERDEPGRIDRAA